MDFYATLGPSCATREVLLQMFRQGMTGVRLNLSHVGLAGCAPMLEEFHAAARAAGVTPKLVIDLQGPEERVGRLEEPLLLKENQTVRLGEEIPVSRRVLQLLAPGDKIALDDSALLLEVEHSGQCKVLQGGTLYSRKSLAVLGKSTNAPRPDSGGPPKFGPGGTVWRDRTAPALRPGTGGYSGGAKGAVRQKSLSNSHYG